MGASSLARKLRHLVLAPRKIVWWVSVKTAVEFLPLLQVGEVM